MDKKHTILVVEDEKPLSEALQLKLKKAGYHVLCALNGQEGLEMALNEHPSLILLDIVMPVMDGITMLDKLRKDAWGKKVSVIILTNLIKVDTLEQMREKGVRQYLIKTDWKLEDLIYIIDDEISRL